MCSDARRLVVRAVEKIDSDVTFTCSRTNNSTSDGKSLVINPQSKEVFRMKILHFIVGASALLIAGAAAAQSSDASPNSRTFILTASNTASNQLLVL